MNRPSNPKKLQFDVIMTHLHFFSVSAGPGVQSDKSHDMYVIQFLLKKKNIIHSQ